MIRFVNGIFQSLKRIKSIGQDLSKLEDLKVLNGRILAHLNKARTAEIIQDLHLAEFKVFSQWGDDGIIQFLIDYLDIEHKIFVEFGVEYYKEANTRFLLINNNWTGLIMDGSAKNIDRIRRDDIYWKYDLTALPVFVTREIINSIITSNGIQGEIGILHIDIDGNDYWVWKEITCISPVIVIMEYNSVFGDEKPWTVPYNEKFYRTNYHFSNLLFGASLLSLCDLAEEKGYCFIGCNSHGNNAYFVRKDKIRGLLPKSAKEGFVMSKFRESRNKKGELTYRSGKDRLREIRNQPVYNTRTQQMERIPDLP